MRGRSTGGLFSVRAVRTIHGSAGLGGGPILITNAGSKAHLDRAPCRGRWPLDTVAGLSQPTRVRVGGHGSGSDGNGTARLPRSRRRTSRRSTVGKQAADNGRTTDHLGNGWVRTPATAVLAGWELLRVVCGSRRRACLCPRKVLESSVAAMKEEGPFRSH